MPTSLRRTALRPVATLMVVVLGLGTVQIGPASAATLFEEVSTSVSRPSIASAR